MFEQNSFESIFAIPQRNGLTKPKRVRGKGIKMINMGELFSERIIHDLPMDRVPCTEKELASNKLEQGDLLFARQSLTLEGAGKSSIFVGDNEDVVFESHLIRCRLDKSKADPRYYFYFFESKFGKQRISSIVEQVAAAGIRGSDLVKLPVFIPPISEQKAIAHILGTLDDKIELNKKLNQTLEDIAKAIFKSWFVDFDPVCAKAEGRPTGLPADISDLFPDELVDSEIGEIPRGWEVGKLLDTANITMGQSPPGDTYNENGKGLPFYQGSTDFGFRFPSLRKFCSQPKRLAKVDDVLMSIRAPVGDINRAREECCIGRGLAAICSKNSSQSWAFYRCKFLSEQLSTFNSEGTVFGAINSKDLKNLQTIIAPDAVIEYFDQIVKPMDDSIKNKTYEIGTLAQLRDTLLLKLISGELRVPDAERFIATIDDAPSA